MDRTGIVIHNIKTVYWSIPKNACTSLRKYFADYLGLEYSGKVHDAPFEWTNEVREDYFHFAIVRHPINRLYSLYKNKFHSDLRTNEEYNKGVERAVFSSWNILKGDMTFNEFVKFVITVPYKYAEIHFKPQCLILPESDLIKCIKLVDIDKELPEVFKKLGLNYSIPYENKTDYTYGWKQVLSKNNSKLLNEYYAGDFARFGY